MTVSHISHSKQNRWQRCRKDVLRHTPVLANLQEPPVPFVQIAQVPQVQSVENVNENSEFQSAQGTQTSERLGTTPSCRETLCGDCGKGGGGSTSPYRIFSSDAPVDVCRTSTSGCSSGTCSRGRDGCLNCCSFLRTCSSERSCCTSNSSCLRSTCSRGRSCRTCTSSCFRGTCFGG